MEISEAQKLLNRQRIDRLVFYKVLKRKQDYNYISHSMFQDCLHWVYVLKYFFQQHLQQNCHNLNKIWSSEF